MSLATPLYRHHSTDPSFIVLLEPYDVYLTDYIFSVPEYTMSDGASIPSLCWSVLGLHPLHYALIGAAVVHDYLYAKQLYTRKESDQIFYKLLRQSLGISKSFTLYSSVRAWGWIAWNRHKKKNLEKQNESS